MMTQELHNENAELAVLAALTLREHLLDMVDGQTAIGLSKSDFFYESHRQFFGLLTDLHWAGKPLNCDEVTLHPIQQRLMSFSSHTLYAEAYAAEIKELARRRRIVDYAGQLATLAHNPQTALDKIADLIEQASDNLTGTLVETPDDMFKRRSHQLLALDDWLEDAEQASNLPTIRNPLECINHHGGFAEFLTGGKVMVLAAPSGGGKTTVLDMMLENLVKDGVNVMLWTGEWTPDETARRMLQQLGGPSMDQLFREQMAREYGSDLPLESQPGRLANNQRDQAINTLREFGGRMISGEYGEIFEVDQRYTSLSLKETLRRMKAKLRDLKREGVQVPIVVFDYIQLVNIDDDVKAKNEAEYAFGQFKQFCMAEGVIGIMTSQVLKNKQAGGIGAGDLYYLRPDKTNITVIIERVTAKDGQALPYMSFNIVKNSLGRLGKTFVHGTMEGLRLDIRAENIVPWREVEAALVSYEASQQDEEFSL